MNIDPRGLTLRQWADTMSLVLDKTIQVERLDHNEEWREWATNILRTPSIEGQNVPNPYQFNDWREWAMRFNQVVDLPG